MFAMRPDDVITIFQKRFIERRDSREDFQFP